MFNSAKWGLQQRRLGEPRFGLGVERRLSRYCSEEREGKDKNESLYFVYVDNVAEWRNQRLLNNMFSFTYVKIYVYFIFILFD